MPQGGIPDAGIADLEGLMDKHEFKEACAAQSFQRLFCTPQLGHLRQYMRNMSPQHSNDHWQSLYA